MARMWDIGDLALRGRHMLARADGGNMARGPVKARQGLAATPVKPAQNAGRRA